MSHKKNTVFIFFTILLFFMHECLLAKTNDYYTLGLKKSGVQKTLTQIKLKAFKHPISFKEKDLYDILTSLYYSNYIRNISLWEQGKNALFKPREAKKIAHLIRKSFERSTPEQMVYFSIGKSKQKTAGNIFSANSKLYFHFQTIKGKKQEWEGRGEPYDLWKLVPQKGQSDLEQKGFLGLVDTYTEWIIIENTRRNQGGEEKNTFYDSPEKDYSKIENKLRFLKDLLSKGLITEEDYRKKKTKLLDGL